MILITGGTGFVGNVIIRQLSDLGYPVKLLLHPSRKTPDLPKGIPFEATVTSLTDEKGVRVAMKDVDIIFHLASAESSGRQAELSKVDIQGTETLVRMAHQAKVGRLIYLSHLGADQASAYPLLKAKGMAENMIKSSGIPYTIFQSAMAYGEHDTFTNGLAFLIKISPYIVMLPNKGSTLLQPIWVEDLATCLTWSLDLPWAINKTIEIGGPEYLSFKEICMLVSEKLGIRRYFLDVPPVFLNVFTELLEIMVPNFPTSVFWMDTLATDRTASLDVLPRQFNLLPARMKQRLGHLEGKKFIKDWRQMLFQRKRSKKQWE